MLDKFNTEETSEVKKVANDNSEKSLTINQFLWHVKNGFHIFYTLVYFSMGIFTASLLYYSGYGAIMYLLSLLIWPLTLAYYCGQVLAM